MIDAVVIAVREFRQSAACHEGWASVEEWEEWGSGLFRQ